jgi:hypothetical protein
VVESGIFAHTLLTRLEARCPRLGVRDLPKTAEAVEAETRSQIAEAARSICFPVEQPLRRVPELDGVPYEIMVSGYPDDPASLGVAVVPRIVGRAPPKLSRLRIKTPSLLRTQSAFVRLPVQLRHHEEAIATATSSLVSAGSTWFERRLLSSIRLDEADVISSLYTYFRSLLPPALQTVPVWFGTQHRGQSHYILDPEVAEDALAGFVASASSLASAPGACMADFLNATIPLEEAFASQVVKENQGLDFEFSKARYSRDRSSVQLAEIAMYGGNCLSLFPICIEADTHLLAAFPTKFKPALLPVFEAAKPELTKRFHRARSKLDRAYRRMVARGWGWSSVGFAECAGAFLGGFSTVASK